MRSVGVAAALALTGALAGFGGPSEEGPRLRLRVANGLDLSRPGETVEVPAAAIAALARGSDLSRVHVLEDPAGTPVTAQPVDADGDGAADLLVFQADFGPRAERRFSLRLGERRLPRKEDFRVYGRFVRERFDDFAWENDRIAHRMYGPALETWEKEPLSSSGVDVWCKRTRRLVVDDWYMTDDYHRDAGEGGDFYSVGRTRGCGGSGIWHEGRLHVSRNFRRSRVLANGPIRLVFELEYEPWEAGPVSVSEVKRITVDAGRNLHRFESSYRFYRREGQPHGEIVWAAGIAKHASSASREDRPGGWLRAWEPLPGDNGSLGCGIVVDPAQVVEATEADGNHLLVSRSPAGAKAVYHAGAGWDRSGDFAGVADWDRHLDEWSRRLRSPLRVDVEP
jgi:pectinesterase